MGEGSRAGVRVGGPCSLRRVATCASAVESFAPAFLSAASTPSNLSFSVCCCAIALSSLACRALAAESSCFCVCSRARAAAAGSHA